jgi:glycerol-3-phosphate dehydrogenase (NAD(P)+)
VQLSKKHEVAVWEFDRAQVTLVARDRTNAKFLPGIRIPDNVIFLDSLQEVMDFSDVVIFAVPSHVLRQVSAKAGAAGTAGKHLVSLVKGLEDRSYLRMTEVMASETKTCKSLSSLSGPSHAEEVARNVPTAVILATAQTDEAGFLQSELSTDTFRLYLNDDITGVELGGAVKNVIAIAAGICDGLGFGANTKAALLTRGMEEMKRLVAAMGGRESTITGLSGIGDLITTCISGFSRNRHVGEELGKGKKLREILGNMVMVAEGVNTTTSVHHLAVQKGLEMPITAAVHRILFGNADPAVEVVQLMARPFKREFE